jgi:ABC-type Fe3+ transport system permease subunit
MRSIVKALIILIAVLAVFIPLASSFPDGLEKVAESLGVEEPEAVWSGLMPDYAFPLIADSYLTKLISGFIGLLLAFGVAWGVGWVVARRSRS